MESIDLYDLYDLRHAFETRPEVHEARIEDGYCPNDTLLVGFNTRTGIWHAPVLVVNVDESYPGVALGTAYGCVEDYRNGEASNLAYGYHHDFDGEDEYLTGVDDFIAQCFEDYWNIGADNEGCAYLTPGTPMDGVLAWLDARMALVEERMSHDGERAFRRSDEELRMFLNARIHMTRLRSTTDYTVERLAEWCRSETKGIEDSLRRASGEGTLSQDATSQAVFATLACNLMLKRCEADNGGGDETKERGDR